MSRMPLSLPFCPIPHLRHYVSWDKSRGVAIDRDQYCDAAAKADGCDFNRDANFECS